MTGLTEVLLPLTLIGLAGVGALLLVQSLWAAAALAELRRRVDTLQGQLTQVRQPPAASPLARGAAIDEADEGPVLVAHEELVARRRAIELRLGHGARIGARATSRAGVSGGRLLPAEPDGAATFR
jgi:hypothetical protein